MDKLHPIIRWILFIPASLIAGWASYFVILLVHKMKSFGGLAEYFIQLSASGLSGAAAIYVAYYIAPHFKKRVVLGYVVVAFLLILLTLLTVPIFDDSLMENLRYAAQNIGIFAMGWYLYREEENA